MRPNQNRRGRGHGHSHGHRNGNGHSGGGSSSGPRHQNNNRNMPVRYQMFESKGLEIKVRGNPSQIHEKYMAMARDAAAAGDLIRAESHYQHAEHYFRLLNSEPRPQQGQPGEFTENAPPAETTAEAVVESMVPPQAPRAADSDDDKTDAA